MQSLRRLVLATLTALLALPASAATLPEHPISFDRLRDFFPPAAVIVEAQHACLQLDALLADTRERQARGLMFVASMPEDAGMLFTYPRPRRLAMWMKNTLHSLDIVFADAEGRIINIAFATEPLSTTSIPAAAPARYVLELPAGRANDYGLAAGSKLHIH